jgi:DNA-binding CsgD family transcriptional regulator
MKGDVISADQLIGRDDDLAAVDDFLERLEEGPRALFVEGEAGIGKTRLWREGVERARERGHRVLSTRPGGSDVQLAYAGLSDLLRNDASETLPELPVPQRRALGIALLLEEANGAPLDDRAVAAAFLGSLRSLAGLGPLLLAVDDLQWLDTSSRAALAFALRRMEDNRIGLLATVRTELGAAADDLTRVLPDEYTERRDLQPMSVAALYDLVRTRFGTSLTRPILMRLHELSGGNPFYAIELIRGFVDDGAGPGTDLAVPRKLSQLLRARLAAMSEPTQEVLLLVAALARPSRETLEHVDARIDDALDEALAADIVEETAAAIRFTHPLLASVHYVSASATVRRAAHRTLADANLGSEERARHLALAAEEPSEDVAHTLDGAVELARGRGALASAAELAELSLSLTPAGEPAVHVRSLAAADLRFSSGDIEGADRLLTEALERKLGEAEQAEIMLRQAKLEHERDQQRSYTLLRRTVELTEEDDGRARVEALCMLATGFPQHADGAPRRAALAVRCAVRSADPLLLAEALGARAQVTYNATGVIETDLLERSVALAESAGDAQVASDAAATYAATLLDSWELDRAREIFEGLVHRHRARQDSLVANALEQLAFVELMAGNLDRAADLAREALDVAAQAGRVHSEMYALLRLGWVEALRGNVDVSRAHSGRALRLAEQSSGFVRGARLTLGYLESALGNHETAWSLLDPADQLTGSMPPGRPVLHVPEAVEVLATLGRTQEARALLAPFEERALTLDRTWAIALAAHARSVILTEEGDLAAAEEAATEAVAITEANRWPVHLGRALLSLGSVQRQLRRKSEARATLGRAVAVFDEIGAPIWAARARRELRRIGGRRSPTKGLSETERQIVELVVSGRSNKEVASALHLSPKTVEWNLSRIYRKLGIHSRTQLAAVRRQGSAGPT